MNMRSWTPIRRGLLYCSPACGANCTVKEYEAAVRRANAMVRSLGPLWQPQVYENLGWHAAAVRSARKLRVCDNVSHGFTAFVADGRFAESGKTARHAVRNAVATARAVAAEILDAVDGL